jgi:hypothetical protein
VVSTTLRRFGFGILSISVMNLVIAEVRAFRSHGVPPFLDQAAQSMALPAVETGTVHQDDPFLRVCEYEDELFPPKRLTMLDLQGVPILLESPFIDLVLKGLHAGFLRPEPCPENVPTHVVVHVGVRELIRDRSAFLAPDLFICDEEVVKLMRILDEFYKGLEKIHGENGCNQRVYCAIHLSHRPQQFESAEKLIVLKRMVRHALAQHRLAWMVVRRNFLFGTSFTSFRLEGQPYESTLERFRGLLERIARE